MSDNSITIKEYKKLSLNFRTVASRFLRCDYDEYQECLKRFLFFIEDTPLINEFIQENNIKQFDIQKIIKTKPFHEKFKLPINKSDEIAFIYQMLKFISDNELDITGFTFGGYGTSKIQRNVENFNYHIVKPLVDYIVTYLGELKIDMGIDGKTSTQYNIGEFKGQLNHAEGQSKITATQIYNEPKLAELKEVASRFIEELNQTKSISSNEKEDTTDIVEAAIQEVQSEKPKKVIIKTAIEKVKSIGELAKAGTSLCTLGAKLVELLEGKI